MKKTMALVLVAALCLGFCACGNRRPAETGIPSQQDNQSGKGQSAGSIETDHPAFPHLLATWKLQNEEDVDRNPYTVITFYKDGTCIMDGAEHCWEIFEEHGDMLLVNILSGSEKIAGAAVSCSKDGLNTYFNAMAKEDYNFCPGVWEKTSD